jgi:hypothetical protein
MAKILKNTTAFPIEIGDAGVTLQPTPTDYTIPPTDYLIWASSSDIITEIGSGNVVVNDGSEDLNISDGTDLIKGIFPKKISLADSEDLSRTAEVTEDRKLKVESKLERGEQLDAWGKLRTSLPSTLFELNFTNSKKSLNMNEKLESGASTTFNYNKAGVDMTLPTVSGARVIRQTKRYFRYITGKSVTILTALNPQSPKTNVVKRWGYFDVNDGMFFQQNQNGFQVVIRTSESGSPVDNIINQEDWNIDKLDGTGKSGITLQSDKYNIWVIDFAWQGAGGVRFGVFIDGAVVYAHEYRTANQIETSFTRTPILPIRFEIFNSNTTSSTTTVTHGTLGIVVEGSSILEETANVFSASRLQTPRTVGTTLVPILSIRPKLLFNGKVNRIPVELEQLSISSETQIIYWQLLKNTSLTGDSFVSVADESVVEYDISSTAFSGGTKIHEGYILASSQGNTTISQTGTTRLSKLNYIGLDIDGNSQENFTLVARTISSTSNVFAIFSWEEF